MRNDRERKFEKEVPEFKERLVAINRVAKVVKGGKNFRFTALMVVGTTIPHQVEGKYGKGHVRLLPAEEGTGVIAGGPVRAVLEMVGIKDIRTKSYGSNNPSNCVKATLNGLSQLRTAEQIAALRGKSVEELLD